MERPDLYVLARFLDALARPGSAWTRAKLQPAVRLNYDLFRRYLAFLVERGWVMETQGPNQLFLTPLGHTARTQLVDWLARWLDGGAP